MQAKHALAIARHIGISVEELLTGDPSDTWRNVETRATTALRYIDEASQLLTGLLKGAAVFDPAPATDTANAPPVAHLKPLRSKPNHPDPDDSRSVREVAPEYGPSEDTDTLGPVPVAGPRMVDVPLRHGAAAGEPRETFFLGDVFAVEADRLTGPVTDYAAFEIAGNSMTNAGIDDGDIVVIRKTQEARERQIHLFRHDGRFTLKRFERDRDGTVRLAYDDGSGDSVVVEPGDWEVVGAFCFVARRSG